MRIHAGMLAMCGEPLSIVIDVKNNNFHRSRSAGIASFHLLATAPIPVAPGVRGNAMAGHDGVFEMIARELSAAPV
jgi:hypothetical protein